MVWTDTNGTRVPAQLPDVFERKILPDKMPFRYMTRETLPQHRGQLIAMYLRLQKIAITLVILLAKKRGKKLKLTDRRISRKTKKQTKRRMTLKQKKAINAGRKRAGLQLIRWKK
tara:strand:+ start:57 stop:401 length:345 start_codon:yes stop_codon:yes gene_type:complete